MSKSVISIPVKWEQFLKRLADDHQVDLNSVISELCAWAFSNPETKKQFEAWLNDAFPQKVKLKIKQMLKTKKQARLKKKTKTKLKRKPTRTETTVKTEN